MYKKKKLIQYLNCFVIIIFLPKGYYSQINVTQSEIMQIFEPGNPLYIIGEDDKMINVGKQAGPNAYDFSFVNLENKMIMHNYKIDQFPELASRYPSDAVTFGDQQRNIFGNPVFLSRTDSTYIIGDVSIGEEYRAIHFEPYELFFKSPIIYDTQFDQNINATDTIFNQNWNITSTQFYNYHLTVKTDGYGTLKLPNMNLECLRMVRYYSWYDYKEFFYITKEGILLVVSDVSIYEPDSGNVRGDYVVISNYDIVGVKSKNNFIPLEFRLEQNYPNPFNPITTIKYSIPAVETGHPANAGQVTPSVRLIVYDILGHEITTLVNEQQPPGNYEVVFDATDLPSGIYLYRLRAGEFNAARKMTLLK